MKNIPILFKIPIKIPYTAIQYHDDQQGNVTSENISGMMINPQWQEILENAILELALILSIIAFLYCFNQFINDLLKARKKRLANIIARRKKNSSS